MKTWHEGARSGHTHEPNEVTVQLDGLGRQLSELTVQPSAPEGPDGPVFVDESGRRGKTLRRLGWVLAAACACYGVTLAVALIGGSSSAPWLPLSGPGKHKGADVVHVPPAPTGSTGAPSLPGDPAGRTATGSTPGDAATPSGRTAAPAPVGPDRGAASSAPAVPPPTQATGGRKPGAAPSAPAPSADATAMPSAGTSTPPADSTTPPAESPQPSAHQPEGAER